ncbi:H-NS histone family protein [Burkholderia sp. GS2Y]|uniref:H-NS histone family protein n=1 Tax=Burkholderia theae TaxID=3143496 RepID=A0ABU9WUP5_9BURK
MERYLDLIKQQRELQQKVLAAREREVGEAISMIIKTMVTYEIGISEIRKALAKANNFQSRLKHSPKYIDPATGRTWSGSGRTPKWLIGKNFDDYLLSQDP